MTPRFAESSPVYHYDVTLTPPPVLWNSRPDLNALYDGPCTLRIRAHSAAEAARKARLMIPWRLTPTFFEAFARLADRTTWGAKSTKVLA